MWCCCWTGPVDPLSLLKSRAMWMMALRLVLLLGYESVVVSADGL
jgi:hypothetical protein